MLQFPQLAFCFCLLLFYKQKKCIRWKLNGFLTLCFLRGFTDSNSKGSEFQPPWIKIFHEAKGIFLCGGMPYLFTHGKHPTVNGTSVLLHLKIFFPAVNARLSLVAKMMFACGLRGQFFQAVLYCIYRNWFFVSMGWCSCCLKQALIIICLMSNMYNFWHGCIKIHYSDIILAKLVLCLTSKLSFLYHAFFLCEQFYITYVILLLKQN